MQSSDIDNIVRIAHTQIRIYFKCEILLKIQKSLFLIPLAVQSTNKRTLATVKELKLELILAFAQTHKRVSENEVE